MLNKVSWSLLLLSALLVAAYAFTNLALPGLRQPFVAELFQKTPWAIGLHMLGGLVAIVTGAFQVNARLRARRIELHRLLGRVYVIAVLVGGVAGLVLSFSSFGGPVTHAGFGLMAVLWLVSTGMAYHRIRQRDVAAHRAWMLRSYALTLAAVTLRIYLGLSQVVGMDFAAAYPAIAWLCWVPNLILVEWVLLRRVLPLPNHARG